MPKETSPAQRMIAKASEDALKTEAYHLYAKLIACMTAFQLGKGPAPTDDDFVIWRAAQQKRLETATEPINTYLPRP